MFELYGIHKEKKDNKKLNGLNKKRKAEEFEKKAAKPKKNNAKKKKVSEKGEAVPAPKRPKTNVFVELVNKSAPSVFFRERVAKIFDGEVYFGTITAYDEFWKVDFDDGDAEDWEKKDLIRALKLYAKCRKDDPHCTAEKPES
jgi:hypothetical protein